MKPARVRNKRRLLSQFLNWTGVLALANQLHPPTLTIFCCHRIRKPGVNPRFDDGVYDIPRVEDFNTLVKLLARNGDAVSEKDIIDSIYHQRQLPRRSFIITFDDGYEECHSIVMPTLKAYSMSGLFFIPTQAIDDRQLGWWDQFAWILKRTKHKTVHIRGVQYDLPADYEKALNALKHMMKLTDDSNNRTLLNELSQACDVPAPSTEESSAELLTWNQIREMKASGMAIGSHTHTHRVLATLNLETQKQELTFSKHRIETELGEPIHSISYPVGGYEHFHHETKTLSYNIGYRLGFSYHTGVNAFEPFDALNLKRIATPHRPSELLAALALPSIFSRRSCAAESPKSFHLSTKT